MNRWIAMILLLIPMTNQPTQTHGEVVYSKNNHVLMRRQSPEEATETSSETSSSGFGLTQKKETTNFQEESHTTRLKPNDTVVSVGGVIKDISFDFDVPNLHVHFTAPASNGCEISICKGLSTAEDCHRKKTEAGVTTAIFKKIKAAELYYMTGTCMLPQGRGPPSPWIKLITPTTTKRTTPKEISMQGSGIKPLLQVEEGLNVDLVWGFSFSNGSRFHVHYVKTVELIVYRKRSSDSAYAFEKTKEKGANGKVRLGLSPSYTFTLGCFFYAMNVTFEDNTKLFLSTDEICYDMFSASFLIAYILVALLIVLAICGIALSSRMPRYAGDKRDEPPPKPKSQKSQRTPKTHSKR